MKKFISGAALLCLAFAVVAGPEQIIKQRARDVAGQGNTRPGTPPATPPPAANPAPPPRPAAPDPVAKVRADLATLVAAVNVTPAQKEEFRAHLAALARGTVKPSAVTLTKFAESLAGALPGSKLDAPAQSRLASQLNLLFNGASLSATRTQEVLDDVKRLLLAGGVVEATTTALMAGLESIVADLQTPR